MIKASSTLYRMIPIPKAQNPKLVSNKRGRKVLQELSRVFIKEKVQTHCLRIKLKFNQPGSKCNFIMFLGK